jgi:hypothetical protein
MAVDPNRFRYNYGLGAAPGTNQNFNDPFGDPTGLGQSRYDLTYRVFPTDLGNEDNSHYMIININVQAGIGATTAQPGLLAANEQSKVDQLRFGNLNNTNTAAGQNRFGGLSRGTRRIAQSIALHMPQGGLVYTEDNKYEEVSMTALAGSAISGVAGIIDKATDTSIATQIVNSVGSVISKGTQVGLGRPLNPRVEVLFAARPQRQWMFEVLMAPRSQKEAQVMHEIIKTLRFYAAPAIVGAGFFFVPPDEFDITFYRAGIENTFLPRINTCVLERLDIDYAPQGGAYSTFRTGEPVAVRMSMGFREVEILHKQRVLQGF